MGALSSVISLVPLSASCSEPGYVENLVHTAERLKLHEERGWHALLHYGKSMTGSYRSKIDDPHFFNSPIGRTDASAELEATLRSLFLVDPKDGQSSICRFPARYAWLAEQLQIDQSQIPVATCTERNETFEAIAPQSAVLVFPVGHINSPASMFGHTLIRIDGKNKSSLISYAVNYSAANTDSNGLAYAWKGLTGMYKGFYSLMPYYDKVREYNDLEHRDMWEYKLSLTSAEVRRMLEHIWELQNIESSYYFLDENCSYNLMFLMEVARPELRLTEKAGFFVLPSDTVQIAMNSSIIDTVTYRPSRGATIKKMRSLLDSQEQTIAHDIAMMKDEPARVKSLPVSTVEKINILDLAASFVQYRFGRKEMGKEAYSRQYLGILRERSSLGTAPENLYGIEEPVSPDKGHGTTRVSTALGVHGGRIFSELNVRPEFHALLDPDQGYLPGAQIKFLDTVVRYGIESENFYLKSLRILDIMSIAPRDTFFQPVSWKVATGFDRELLRDRQEHLIYHLNTGGGYSYQSLFGGLWFMFGELDIATGRAFRSGIAAAPGFTIGSSEQLSTSTKFLLTISAYWYGLGDTRTVVKTVAGLNQRISQNNSISLDASHEYMNHTPLTETSLRWNYYY
jgi:hypothetical protein